MDNIEQIVKIVGAAVSIMGSILAFFSFVDQKSIAITFLSFEKRGKLFASKLFLIFATFFLLCFLGGGVMNSANNMGQAVNASFNTNNEEQQSQVLLENGMNQTEENQIEENQAEDKAPIGMIVIVVIAIPVLVSVIETMSVIISDRKKNEFAALYTKHKYVSFYFLVFVGIGLTEVNMIFALISSANNYMWRNLAISFASALCLTLSILDVTQGYAYKALYELQDDEKEYKYIFAREGDLFVLGSHPYIDHCKEFRLMAYDDIKRRTFYDSINSHDVFWNKKRVLISHYYGKPIDEEMKKKICERIAIDLYDKGESLSGNAKLYIEIKYIKDKIVYRINRKTNRLISEEAVLTSKFDGNFFFVEDDKKTIKKIGEKDWKKGRKSQREYMSDGIITKDIFMSEVEALKAQYDDIKLVVDCDKAIVKGYCLQKKRREKVIFEIDFWDYGYITGKYWVKNFKKYEKTKEIADAIQAKIHSYLY